MEAQNLNIKPIEKVHSADVELAAAGRGSRYDKFRREFQTFCRFMCLLKPYKDKLTLIILLIFVGVPLGELGLFLNRYLLDDVILAEDRTMDQRLSLLVVILLTQLTIWVVQHGMNVIQQIMSFYLDFSVSIKLRKWFYDHLHKLDLAFLQTRPVGEHMFRATADVSGMGRNGVVFMITDDIPQAFRIVYRLMWGAALLIAIDWKIAAVLVLSMFPYTYAAQKLYTWLKGVIRRERIQAQRVNAILRDGLKGGSTVKGMGQIDYQVRRFSHQLIEHRRAWWLQQLLQMLTHGIVLWSLHQVVVKSVWVYTFYRCMSGEFTYGETIVVLALLNRFQRPLEQFIKLFQQIRIQLVPAERLLETLDVEPQIVDLPDAADLPEIKGGVEFKDVHFEYVEGKPVLQGLNFKVKPGENVAFVGPSGAGKSTVMYLLYRLYEANSGKVLIDDYDVKEVRTDSICEQLGVVLQETHLFGGTFADNIRYGDLDATDEEVIEAAKGAELHEFIMSQPEEYDKDLGEGLKLSGGQQQRLGIARSIIRDPRIMILDEATASLDSKTETKLTETIENLMEGRTTLMISHRLVTVKDCDRIIVLEEGKLLDEGTHEELLKKCDLYKQMWDEQTREGLN